MIRTAGLIIQNQYDLDCDRLRDNFKKLSGDQKNFFIGELFRRKLHENPNYEANSRDRCVGWVKLIAVFTDNVGWVSTKNVGSLFDNSIRLFDKRHANEVWIGSMRAGMRVAGKTNPSDLSLYDRIFQSANSAFADNEDQFQEARLAFVEELHEFDMLRQIDVKDDHGLFKVLRNVGNQANEKVRRKLYDTLKSFESKFHSSEDFMSVFNGIKTEFEH